MGENTRTKSSAARAAIAERRAQALELRKAGATIPQIAAKLGVAKSTAHDDVMKSIAALTREPAKAVLALELERLDAMLMGLWNSARGGDVFSIDRVLKIMDRRARYLGIDTAQTDSGDGDARQALDALVSAITARAATPDPNSP